MADQDDDDEFYFSDDDLVNLPADALLALEQNAQHSTQFPQLERTPITSYVQVQSGPPVIRNPPPTGNSAPAGITRRTFPEPPSSDYGYDDEDVIDLDDQSLSVQNNTYKGRPGGRIGNANAQNVSAYGYQGAVGGQTYPVQQEDTRGYGQGYVPSAVDSHMDNEMDYQDEGFDRQGHTFEGGNITSNTQINLAEMQQRIAELEREKEALIKSNEDAKNTALSKAGEIAIVRRNQEKSTKEYERRISVMQKLHADALSKQKSELENIKKEKEKMETSNRFLEHDLVQEAGKAKASRRLLREPSGPRPGGSANSSPAATPKKHRTLPFRDGFDDEDLVMTSPSKTRERTKASTPRAGSKRKRPIEDSPSLELPLSEPRSLPQLIREESQLAPDIDSNALARLSAEGRKFKFLQRLLTHRPPEQRETILESLTKFAYPSDPNQSLASRIYDQLTILAVGKDHDDFPRKFILVVISLWRQCVAERYFAPLYLILDALQFLLAYEPMATRASLVEDITPLAIATADVVAIPIGRASKNPTAASNKDGPLHRQHCAEIDVYECLLVLHTTVLSCVTSPTQLITFWQLISYDFILLMLMSAQPLPQIMLMLRLLTTSPLFNTFGAILPGLETTPQQQHQQSVNEANTIERLTLLLHETPKPAEEDATPYSALEIAELRLAVLDVFASMTLSPHAGRALALHRTALARLVRFLQDAINALYAYHLLTHNLTTRAVNLSIKLIFLLCTNFKEEVNIREKLSAVPGASHKFLVALTRLAFSEQVCLEEGIEEESGEMAHGLLDECLSPEEGEALLEVFSNVGSG